MAIGHEPLLNTNYIERIMLDIPYADQSDSQKLDIYLPNKKPWEKDNVQVPVIIAIHGGGFAEGDKRAFFMKATIDAIFWGYAVVSINYRLSAEAIFPAQIMDVKAAIRWVKANAGKYGFNQNKIALWGGSAGGALAALAGTSARAKELEDLSMGNAEYTSDVNAVVDQFGPINLLTLEEQALRLGFQTPRFNMADSFESKYIGLPIQSVPDKVKCANAESYISPDMPPFLIQHGTSDSMVPYLQSVELAERIRKHAGEDKAMLMLLEGGGHGGEKFDEMDTLLAIKEFLDKHLQVRQEIMIAPPTDSAFIKRKWLDVSYAKQSEAQKLDIYLPNEGAGPFPAIICVHGGAFMMGDKKHMTEYPLFYLHKRGYAVVSVNYRLSSEAIFPAQIYDVKAAIRYIRANAVEYNLDVEKLGAWGGSAGGHLVSLVGTSAGVKALEDLGMGNADCSSAVQAVAAWYPPICFDKMDEHFSVTQNGKQDHNDADSPESRLLGEKITECPEKVAFASPATYITLDIPPFLLEHGSRDQLVPTQQSIEFAEQINKIAGPHKVELVILEGALHVDGKYFMTNANLDKVMDFFDKYVPRV